MSRFLMQPAFRQFEKNLKNRPNFKDAAVHGWGRLILKKIEENKEAASGAVIANRFDPLQVDPTCIGGKLRYYARAFSMDGRCPYNYAPGSFLMSYQDFIYYNPPQVRPDLDLPGPSGILASANRSISPTSTSSNSPSGSTDEVVSDALDVEAPGDASQRNRKQYDKWTNEE